MPKFARELFKFAFSNPHFRLKVVLREGRNAASAIPVFSPSFKSMSPPKVTSRFAESMSSGVNRLLLSCKSISIEPCNSGWEFLSVTLSWRKPRLAWALKFCKFAVSPRDSSLLAVVSK